MRPAEERIQGPYVGDPWDQQPGEPGNMWNRFTWYLDQDPGNRSLKATGEHFGVDKSTISGCADRYRWIERAALYDAHRVKQRRDHITTQELALAEQQMTVAGCPTPRGGCGPPRHQSVAADQWRN